MTETWYRYEDRHTAPPLDEFDNPIGKGGVTIDLLEFEVVRHTPKGIWVRRARRHRHYVDDTQRFVLTNAHKRYVCPTIEEAQLSFLARKKKQLGIYEARAESVRDVFAKARRQFEGIDSLRA